MSWVSGQKKVSTFSSELCSPNKTSETKHHQILSFNPESKRESSRDQHGLHKTWAVLEELKKEIAIVRVGRSFVVWT